MIRARGVFFIPTLYQRFRTRFFSTPTPYTKTPSPLSHAVSFYPPYTPSFLPGSSTTPYTLRFSFRYPKVCPTVYATNSLFCAILCFSYRPMNLYKHHPFFFHCSPTHPGSCLRPALLFLFYPLSASVVVPFSILYFLSFFFLYHFCFNDV